MQADIHERRSQNVGREEYQPKRTRHNDDSECEPGQRRHLVTNGRKIRWRLGRLRSQPDEADRAACHQRRGEMYATNEDQRIGHEMGPSVLRPDTKGEIALRAVRINRQYTPHHLVSAR